MTQPTQARHPWRAMLRTVVAVVIPLLVFMPQIVDAAGIEQYQWAAYLVATSAAITRVLAIPGVNQILAKYLPPLAAAPKAEPPSPEAVRILSRPGNLDPKLTETAREAVRKLGPGGLQ